MRHHLPDSASTLAIHGVRDTDRALAGCLLGFPAVRGVLLGGSRATGTADEASDTDLYALYAGALPAAPMRAAALRHVADEGLVVEETAWGVEDHVRIAGRLVEIVYQDADALGVEAFYDPGVPPTGFTTAFLHTLERGLVVADPFGELDAVRVRLSTFPEATRERILAQVPRELDEYVATLRKAQHRRDWTGVTNRRAAFQAAWFDLLFAVNRRYHPGEKRLLAHAATCVVQVPALAERWDHACRVTASDPDLPELLAGLAVDLVRCRAVPGTSRAAAPGTLDG